MTTLSANIAAPARRTASAQPRISPWVDFILLALLITNLTWSIQAAEWSPGLEQLFPVVAAAIISGTLVARSGFSRVFSTFYSGIVGAAAIIASMVSLAPEGLEGQERAYHIIERTYLWGVNAFSGQPLADNLVFVLVLSLLIWILAYSAVWTYFRERRKWQAILPTGLAMLVNLYYAPSRLSSYFILYLLCAILLLVRATLAEREREWSRQRVQFPFDISFDFMRDGVLFAIFVIFSSWILPSAAGGGQLDPILGPLEKPWNQFQQEWDRLFSTISYGRVVGVPTFGTSLGLEGPRNVTDELVMDVKTPVNRYYRAVVHDTYLPGGGGWTLAEAAGVRLGEEYDFELATWQSRQEIKQTVTTYQGNNVLVAAPQPVRALIPVDAYIVAPAEGTATPPPDVRGGKNVELAMLVARDGLDEGDSYVVVSSISAATIVELRADHQNYPDYIAERYLQLPDTIPQRVFDLADELAGDSDNPYDIAKTVERYLRDYTYNDQIPGPAPGQDGVDYFLFEERQGYCNYYASSMAIMLRHLGIPARLASGYATGELQPEVGIDRVRDATGAEAATYRLRNNDLHTWVEVYFPTYGWIEFEPTASEPVLLRPAGDENTGVSGSGTGGGAAGNEGFEDDFSIPEGGDGGEQTDFSTPASPLDFLQERSGLFLLTLSILGILFIVFWSTRSIRRGPQDRKRPVFRHVPQGFAARLWEKLMNWAKRFDLIEDPSLTPLEQAGAFAGTVPEAAPGIAAIADLYTRDLYSPHPITTDDASDAQLSWLNLRPLLWRHYLDRSLRLPAGLKRALFRAG